MFKRAAAALLWFYALLWAFNFISAFTGMPHLYGVVVGAAVAAFVGLDPFGMIWAGSKTPDHAEQASVVERFPATKVRVTP